MNCKLISESGSITAELPSTLRCDRCEQFKVHIIYKTIVKECINDNGTFKITEEPVLGNQCKCCGEKMFYSNSQ